MKRKYFAIIVLLALFTGCANNVWHKPGASSNDFEADKYTCLQQSQQRAGVAVVNPYGGSAQSGVVTNWNLYNSCMRSKGWSLQNREALQNTSAQNEADFKHKQTVYRAAMSEFDERAKAICAKPDYAAFIEKTPCSSKDINFEQIADSSKITKEQKAILPKFRTDIDALWKERTEYMRVNGKDGDKRWADYLDSVQPEIDKFNLDLYNGTITWGEYNQRRKELTAKMQAEGKRIFQTQ